MPRLCLESQAGEEKVESLGKQGEAAGKVGAGSWQPSRPTPRAPGYTLGSPTGASRLSSARGFLQPNDACSIRSVHSRGH